MAHDYIEFKDEINEIISPITYEIPLQLLAYYISIERGIDPINQKILLNVLQWNKKLYFSSKILITLKKILVKKKK